MFLIYLSSSLLLNWGNLVVALQSKLPKAFRWDICERVAKSWHAEWGHF
jgi:hypothetical protein